MTNLPCITKRPLKYVIQNEEVWLELKTSAKVDYFYKVHKDASKQLLLWALLYNLKKCKNFTMDILGV